ncbi:MAG TPA: 30S ribosomal protein S6 [Thermoguttaceae bacterium]|nr:30S ribosomal protein S6 [Thermoguttaceae bacterium]
MAENVYEGMFILDANRFGRDAEAVSGQISEMIQDAGGKMLVSRLWQERRLAYPIGGQRKGAYWLAYFRLDTNRLAAIRRQCRLTDTILRVLFLKVDPRIVDALVAHAQVGSSDGSERKEEADDQGAKDTTAEKAEPVAVADKADDREA